MRKLVILLGRYYEQYSGGAELQANYLAQHACKYGYEVHWIFISNGAPCINRLNLQLHPIREKTIWNRLGNIKYPYAYNLFKKLKKIKPDVIYQRCGLSFTGLSSLYAQHYGSRLVFHLAHDKDLRKMIIPICRPYLVPEQMLLQYGIRRADAIIAQSHFQGSLLRERFNRIASAVIPNGHPIPENILNKPQQVVSVVWIANMKPIKRPEIFIRLAKELSKTHRVSFTMIGRLGKYYNLANEVAENVNIHVLGEIPNHEVNKLLEQSHILVNTSLQEGFSNTFIQAWMRSVPVVSLNVDPDDVIQREGLGFYSASYSQLVKDTKRLINDQPLREAMGQKARKFAVEHYSLNNMQKILDIISI